MLNVFTGFDDTRAAIAVTRLESIPPLSMIPTGTSAISRRRTESRRRSSSSRTSSDAGRSGPRFRSGSYQYAQVVTRSRSRSKVSACPCGSLCTPARMQSEPGT